MRVYDVGGPSQLTYRADSPPSDGWGWGGGGGGVLMKDDYVTLLRQHIDSEQIRLSKRIKQVNSHAKWHGLTMACAR